jgi:Protein of unknown function (DUF3485)
MKTTFSPVAGAILLAGTLWGGWLHTKMDARRGSDEALNAAAKRLLYPLSQRLGNWRLVGQAEFSADVVRMLQCPAHINCTYVDEQTGDRVSVAVIIGPPGPIAVHTPEICYSSQDYALTTERTAVPIRDRNQREHTLWQVELRPNDVTGQPLRVLYGWGTGDAWSATDDPRFAHASAPYLYKIQLSGPAAHGASNSDPCQNFLQWFLPELQTHLVAPAKGNSASTASNS